MAHKPLRLKTIKSKSAGTTAWHSLTCAIIILSALMAQGCHNQGQTIPDRDNMAAQEVVGAHVRRSEHGHLQMQLDAPLIQRYDKPIAKTIYLATDTSQMQMRFYDGDNGRLKVSICADTGISFDDRNIMEAHGNVVVIDYSSGDTIYLYDLVWNSADDRIYSDHPVRARNGRRLTEGDSFTSDEKMENLQIIRQRGVIEFNE